MRVSTRFFRLDIADGIVDRFDSGARGVLVASTSAGDVTSTASIAGVVGKTAW